MGLLSNLEKFKSTNTFIDTLIGQKIRALPDMIEDSFYDMFGGVGIKIREAKEKSKFINDALEQASTVWEFAVLRKKLSKRISNKLQKKAAIIGKKNDFVAEKMKEAAAKISKVTDWKDAKDHITTALQLDDSIQGIIGVVFNEYVESYAPADEAAGQSLDNAVAAFDFISPQGQDTIRTLLVEAQQKSFNDMVDSDPEGFDVGLIKEHKEKLKDIQQAKPEDLKKLLLEATKNRDVAKSFKSETTKQLMGDSKPAVGRTRTSAQAAEVQKSKGRPQGSKDSVARAPRGRLGEMAAASGDTPNLNSIMNGGDDRTAGMAKEFEEGTSGLEGADLTTAMYALESALQELANQISSGELQPSQISEAMMNSEGTDFGKTSIEDQIEGDNWEDEMLLNTIAIKEALDKGPLAAAEEEGGGLFGKIFDLFGENGMLGKFLGPMAGMVSKILPMIGQLGSLLGPVAAVSAAGFAGYKAGTWLNENAINPLVEKLTGEKGATLGSAVYDGVDSIQSLWGGDDKSKAKESEKEQYQKMYDDKVKAGTKVTPKFAALVSKAGVQVDPAMVLAEGETPGPKAASPTAEMKQQTEEQRKFEEQVASANANAKAAGGTVVNAPTTINNKTVTPPPVNYAPVRTGESAISRAKDRLAIVR